MKTNDLCPQSNDVVMNLTGAGLPTPDAIRFSVVRSSERLPEILELRRVAYLAVQKIAPHTTAADMTDPRDRKATMVIAESAGEIIGSVRLTPPISGPILYRDCQLEGAVLDLPPKSKLLESSWACIHPDHQGKGLFWNLAAHMLITAESYGRPYLVGACLPNLYSSWWRCGFRKTGVFYSFDGLERSVILLDLAATLAGRTISPEFARVLLPLLAATHAAEPTDLLDVAESRALTLLDAIDP